METAHRRIELQSPADLSYLIANATRAAQSKIDLHFPPSAAPETGDDDMRKRVEELVDQYIKTTFALAQPSLNINGLEGPALAASLASPDPATTTAPEELEPYDTRLATKIQSLNAQIESLNLALATARRETPSSAAAAYLTRAAAAREKWERQKGEAQAKIVEDEVRRVEKLGEEEGWGVDGSRIAEMKEVWREACGTLLDVKENVGGTMGKLEKARRAAEYLDGQTQ